MVGPKAGPATTGTINSPIAAPRSSSGKALSSALMTMGNKTPPPMPCSSRPTTSTQNAGDSPHSSDPMVNRTSDATHARFVVKRSSMNDAKGGHDAGRQREAGDGPAHGGDVHVEHRAQLGQRNVDDGVVEHDHGQS